MAELLKSAWRWLEGKKTYAAAGVIFAAAGYGYWTGYLMDVQALLVMGLAFALVGMADKADRYGRMALLLLDQLKAAKEAREKQLAEEQERSKALARGGLS